ncbi:MAG: hypothetical protein ACOYIF_09045 [Acetivibrionales bacterium]|jgi:hypothetical protein
MNSNIEKILYIGTGVLLLVMAFTFFFSNYNLYQEYIEKNNKVMSEDKTVTISEGNEDFPIAGAEVIHQVINAKKSQDREDVFDLYSGSALSTHLKAAEIWVSGKNANYMEVSEINEASFYVVKLEKDTSGNIIGIHYTLQ